MPLRFAVSSCLLGAACRYDGKSKPNASVQELSKMGECVSVCPEVLGGLRIPHPPHEIDASSRALRVVSADGSDGTAAFVRGADLALERVQRGGCRLAILKAKSPSCGSGLVYDGSFSGALVPGFGTAARKLCAAGVRVIDEKRAEACLEASRSRRDGGFAPLLAAVAAECPELTTDRLLLRPLTADDAFDVLSYCSDPDIGADAGWEPHRTLEDAQAFIRDVASAPHVFGIFERRADADGGSASCIGHLGLIGDPRRCNPDCLMLGYALAKPKWGFGYMVEAVREILRYGFEELGLSSVSCSCYTFNHRSRRVIEKCGFAFEGTLHAVEVSPEGKMRDVSLYRLSEEQWSGARSR